MFSCMLSAINYETFSQLWVFWERVKAIKIKKLLSIQFSCLIRSLFDQFLMIQLFFMWESWESENVHNVMIYGISFRFCVVSECVYMKKSHRTVINKAVLILSEWVLWFMIACNVFDHFETQTTTTWAANWWWRL